MIYIYMCVCVCVCVCVVCVCVYEGICTVYRVQSAMSRYMLQGNWCDTVLQLKYLKHGFMGCSVLIAHHLVPQGVRVAAEVFKVCIPGQ